jgi:hypothetical protein
MLSQFIRSAAVGVFSAALILCLNRPVAVAQTTMGTITGVVTDASHAVVAGATVAARNTATGGQARTTTSSTGNYVLPSLQVGTYEVTVSQAGFNTWTRSNISLSSAENVRVDVTLTVGQVNQTVEITAAEPPLKTESTEVSSTMEQKLVEDVPLAVAGIGGGMRNAFSLMIMLPQVRTGDGQSSWDDFNVGGGQQHAWNVSVDGLSIEMGWRNHVGYMNRLTPPVDAIQELHIETAAFKAEDSRASGGNISMVTKSGTNDLHASAFDYYQSEDLDANTWRNNLFGSPKSVYHRNDFGVNAGGPVYLPKIYNGRNKTYFYTAYEGYRFPQTSGVGVTTIPTTPMLNGDFSGWAPNGKFAPIYDPDTTQSNGQGGYTRQVFAGNIIPKSRITPLSANIDKYFPAPNLPGIVNNYEETGAGAKTLINNAFLLKFDQNFTTRNRLSFTWSKSSSYYNDAYDSDPTNPNNWGGSLPYPLAGRQYYHGDQYYGNVFRLSDSHVITPSLVNTVTVGAHRLTHPEHDISEEPFGQNWGNTLGAPGNNPYYNNGFPSVAFLTDNYYSWDSSKLWDEYHTEYGLDESLSWTHGSHSFKFGYNLSLLRLDVNSRNNATGTFNFSRLETAFPLDNSGASGNAFASYLLGDVDNANFSVPNAQELQFPSHAFFAQDDWKITPRLTANLGIRYELNMGVTERHDQLSLFNPTVPNPACDGCLGAMTFLGSGPGRLGSRGLWPHSDAWGPRAGLAYRIGDSTVVRAGFGIFYAPEKSPGLGGANDGFTNNPSFPSPNTGVTPAFNWNNGWPAWQAPPFINPAFGAPSGVSFWQPSELEKVPSTASWNFAISRALPGNMVVDATYTGSKGTHLASNRVNDMQINPQYAYLGSLLTQPITAPAVQALGFTAPFANFTQLLGANATLGQALRRWPQYINVSEPGMTMHDGNSDYEALILKLTKHYSNGLTILTDFTWAKLLTDADSSEPWIAGVVGSGIGGGAAQNNYNRSLEKSYSVLDIPVAYKLQASYDLPFGPARHYLQKGIIGHIVGDWTLATYTFFQSGYPLGVVDTAYQNYLDGGPTRPNVLTSDWRAPVTGNGFDPNVEPYLATSAFQNIANPTVTPFGNAPRLNGATRSPYTVRTNITIIRSFPIKERVHMDFRWEIYDLFNAKTWANPQSLDLANTTLFGIVNNANGNRSMQAALKVVF